MANKDYITVANDKSWLDTYRADYQEGSSSRTYRYGSIQEHAQLWQDGEISSEILVDALKHMCFERAEFVGLLKNLGLSEYAEG